MWEFKCVHSLRAEHYIQLALYMYLAGDQANRFYLYNILSGEHWEITSSPERLSVMVNLLIREKYFVKHGLTDSEFIKKCGEISERYAF